MLSEELEKKLKGGYRKLSKYDEYMMLKVVIVTDGPYGDGALKQ
jgi:hypothetical protein